MVPADAEVVLEGYLDERGWVESEGPYGEYVGYYGQMKTNPVFHLTAITMRRDALFQTVDHRRPLAGLHRHGAALRAAHRSRRVGALHDGGARAGRGLRHALRAAACTICAWRCAQRYPGEVRNAIAAVFGSNADVKHVFVVDDDIDVFSDAQMDWALATRFQADRDLVVASGFRAVPLDPSLPAAAPAPRPASTSPSRSAGTARPIIRVPEAPQARADPEPDRAPGARGGTAKLPRTDGSDRQPRRARRAWRSTQCAGGRLDDAGRQISRRRTTPEANSNAHVQT